MNSMLVDISGVAGAGLMAYGAWLVYPPAGYLVGGALLIGLSICTSLSARWTRRP